MKKIQIFIIILFLFISAVYMPTVMAVGGNNGGNYPPWGGPMPPMCNFCDVNGTWYWEGVNPYLDNVIPYPYDWTGVKITDKGVLTCVNLTLPSGCTANVSFEWLNWTQYFDIWMTWAYAQDWDDWVNISWSTEPYYDNDSFWYNYSSWTNVSQSTQLCEYNVNVSCYTENDWTSNRFDWRVNLDITCPNSTYNATCYYCFQPETCPVSSIYPPSPNGTACPCCDCYCVTVNNELGHNMNLSIYHRHTTRGGSYHPLAIFTNRTNGTYCFCMGETLFSPAYVFDHTNHTNATNPINTWYTVPFNMSHHRIKNIDHSATVDNDTYTIKTTGEYKINYQMKFADSAANPVSEAFTRILINGVEAHGSLMCDDMKKKDAATIISATVMEYLYKGDEITFEYAATHITVSLTSTCTFGDVPFSASIYINHIDDVGQHPMFYNETYEWYVNVTDASTGEYTESDIFQFRTAESPDLCPCGEEAIKLATGRGEILRFGSLRNLSVIAFIFAIAALLAIIVIYHKRKGKEEDEEAEEVINDGL